MSVDKRLSKVKGLREVNNRVEAASTAVNNAREASQHWQEKLTALNEEMVSISAAAYNDREPKALKRATELETEIRQAEYVITGLKAKEETAKATLAFELASQEKLAAATASNEIIKVGKRIAKMQQAAQAHILALAEASLQIKKLARECEILAADYGVSSEGVRWNRVSRPLKEWMMHIFGREIADLVVDTSRVAEHKYQDEVRQVLSTGKGLGISALAEEIKSLNVRSAKEKRMQEVLNVSDQEAN